ncbi:TetR family transcriptional regulator [Streptomyces sp. TRM70308]|uniref:TetR/AcrR family transcriptional regulator n=1 Tax=Streptomyces sp. TRM70308 TaxID=3131932 RepID=UPI003D06228A
MRAGKVSPSAQRGRDVRRRLLAAAAELIGERGWSAVSTRAVAERAGVGAGLVHYHFPSLQALLADAALARVEELLARFAAPLRAAPTPEAGLDHLLGALDAYSGHDAASLLFNETYLAAARDPALARRLADALADTRRHLADWLRAHGAADPEPTAAVLAAALDGVMLHRPLDPGLTAAAVAPVLRRTLARPAHDKGGDPR